MRNWECCGVARGLPSSLEIILSTSADPIKVGVPSTTLSDVLLLLLPSQEEEPEEKKPEKKKKMLFVEDDGEEDEEQTEEEKAEELERAQKRALMGGKSSRRKLGEVEKKLGVKAAAKVEDEEDEEEEPPEAAAPAAAEDFKVPPKPAALVEAADPEVSAKVSALLRPLAAPGAAFSDSAEGSSWDLKELQQWIGGGGIDRLCWVAGEPGERPCELAAELLKQGTWAGALLHHHVRRGDALSQDPIAILRTLAMQLYLAFPSKLSPPYLAVETPSLTSLAPMDGALEVLLSKPLDKVTGAGKGVVVLLGGLDEAVAEARSSAWPPRVVCLAQKLVSVLGEKGVRVLLTTSASQSSASVLERALDDLKPMRIKLGDCRSGPGGMPARLGAEQAYGAYLEARGGTPQELAPLLRLLAAAREPPSLSQLEAWGAGDPAAAAEKLGALVVLEEEHKVLRVADGSVLEFLGAEGPWMADEAAGHKAIAEALKKEMEDVASMSAYGLRNALFHALRAGESADPICGDLAFWQRCFEAREMAAVQDLMRLELKSRRSGVAGDAFRLLSDNQAQLLKDPSALPKLAYDGPHKSALAIAARSDASRAAPDGWLLSRPRDWSPELLRIKAHNKGVNAVAISSDGCMLASGSDDTFCKVHDTATGELLMGLKGHGDEVTAVVFSPDCSTVATASWDSSIILWSCASGKEIRRIKEHKSGVTCLAFRPDGAVLMSGSDDNSVRLWDPATGEQLKKVDGHAMAVNCVCFRADGGQIASGSEDATVCVFDPESGEELHCLEGHSSGINCVAYCPEKDLLASGGWDRSVRIWDPLAGTQVLHIDGYTAAVLSVSFVGAEGAPQPLLATVCGKSVQVRDTKTGDLRFRLSGRQNDITSMAMYGDCVLGCASRDGLVTLLSFDKGQTSKDEHTDTVNSVSCSADGRYLASGAWDNTILVWDLESGALDTVLEGHTGSVSQVAFAVLGDEEAPGGGGKPNRRVHALASAGNDMSLRLWNVQECREETSLAQGYGETEGVTAVAMAGAVLASGEAEGGIRLWEADRREETGRLSGHNGSVNDLSFSADGTVLASGGDDGNVLVWDVSSQERTCSLGASAGVASVAVSRKGDVVAAAMQDGSLGVWDTQTSKLKLDQDSRSGCDASCVALSPDGGILAIGESDGSIQLLDTTSNDIKVTWTSGHTAPVMSIAFSPCGSMLYSGSEDQKVRAWQVPK